MKRPLLACVTSLCLAACGSLGPGSAAQTITLAGAPNGVAVRVPEGTIYVTDDASNGIVASSDAAHFAPYATLPAAGGQRNSLSQIAIGADGDLFVERFGFGSASAIFRVDAAGHVTLASDANPSRRRLGLAVLSRTELLSSWFVKQGDDPAQGGVSLVTRDQASSRATERDIVVGLGKPVGLAIIGDTLYITDQTNNRIVKVGLHAALAAAAPLTASDVFANVTAPDLLAASPDGTLYTKCGEHGLCRFSKTGEPTVLADDFDEPRGVAVDAAHKRLVAVDRARGAGRPSHLRIMRLD
jgi:DNA-binding beta-propeller fold protein YncE